MSSPNFRLGFDGSAIYDGVDGRLPVAVVTRRCSDREWRPKGDHRCISCASWVRCFLCISERASVSSGTEKCAGFRRRKVHHRPGFEAVAAAGQAESRSDGA
jgi:hypothetical protein